MKRAGLGAILRYEGELVEVVGIADARTLDLRPLGAQPCPTCGQLPDKHLVEHSPLFQDNATAVNTLQKEREES